MSSPLTNLLTELLDADAFDAAGEAFTALLEWCYSLLSLPALKHPQSCVRLQNLLLHHLLPPPPDPGDPNPSVGALAAAEVMLRSASQLGDIDAIDREVMANDKAIYQNYFVAKFAPDALRKKFEKSFTGFDDSDMAKVEAWNNTSV